MQRRHVFLFLGFAITAGVGYWLATTAAPVQERQQASAPPIEGPKRLVIPNEREVKFRRENRPESTFKGDSEATQAGALPGQRILAFRDQAALEDFLKRAGDKVRILGRLDQLNALRIGLMNPDDLAGLLNGDEESSLIYPVDVPAPGNTAQQAGAVELGAGLLDWLGITGDNSTWGTGVRIAILDTGVALHPAFSSLITGVNLVALPADLSQQNGHGTAVASVIIGNNVLTPGVAPGAEIASYRIANDLGQSDSYMLAQGIVAAVDGGAQLINISMASFGDSALVRNAIEYAQAAGALIVAAAGNDGTNRVSYPAANAGVLAIGAVDALGNHMNFSNTGTQIAMSAPGYGVNAAWTGDQAAKVDGTSFSSPIVVGAIAALMSQNGSVQMTPQQAVALLTAYLNDGGTAGADSSYGGGMPDLGRVINRTNRGIYDAAVASQTFLAPTPATPYGQVEILIQNRGTEPLVNTGVTISTPNGEVKSNITSLSVGAVRSVIVPVPFSTTSSMRYGAAVSLSGAQMDSKPSNDQRVQIYAPVGAK